MDEHARQWMEYASREVRAACHELGWGHQLRRKWTIREKPLRESSADDYEWKLLPNARGELPDLAEPDFDGTYFLISIDRANYRFLLQHDTHHVGVLGPIWELATFTTIGPPLPSRNDSTTLEGDKLRFPDGWLQKHVISLAKRFRPNTFSIT